MCVGEHGFARGGLDHRAMVERLDEDPLEGVGAAGPSGGERAPKRRRGQRPYRVVSTGQLVTSSARAPAASQRSEPKVHDNE